MSGPENFSPENASSRVLVIDATRTTTPPTVWQNFHAGFWRGIGFALGLFLVLGLELADVLNLVELPK